MIIYDAKQLSEKMLDKVKSEVDILNKKPKIIIIQANNDRASDLYVNNKLKMCERVGIEATHIQFDSNVSNQELLSVIKLYNEHKDTNAILVQLPLFSHLNEKLILQKISPAKDVDSLVSESLGKLFEGDMSYLGLTPKGVLSILDDLDIDLKGKNAVVLGRSVISGKSTALGLLSRDCTVSILHSKSNNARKLCRKADIVVSCMGQAEMINSKWLKDGAIVINVGFCKNSEGKTVGDIDFKDIVENSKVSVVTRVFNTSGLMTTTHLTKRVLELYKIQKGILCQS